MGKVRQPNPNYNLPNTREAANSKAPKIQNRANINKRTVHKTK